MKKMFFYAAVAGVAFASCTKGVDAPVNNGTNNEPAISFQMGSSFDVTVRGTGAVGGLGTPEDPNNWNGEKLNVYMFDQNTLDLTFNATTGVNYFENTTVTAPTTGSTGEATYGKYQYYPSSGEFDFFAYHGDDAVTVAPALNAAEDAYTVPVVINGEQDLMVAKAALNDLDRETIAAWEANNPGKAFDLARVYSAYSARRDVQPRFTFKHLLSRFVFQAEAAEPGAAGANGIKITQIVVKAPSNGVMTVAALDESELGVVFGTEPADSADMVLTDRGNTMEVKELIHGESVRMGESMLLPAGGTQYVAHIYYKQEKINDDGTITTINDVYVAPIVLKDNKPFEAGTQYKVNIKVYDFMTIVLTADLQAWKEGEDIPVDSE